EGLIAVDDISVEIRDLYDRGMQGGEHPGSAALARHYTVKPGLWTLVTGIPSHGKSAFLDWLMVNLARRAGWHFAICSPETQPLRPPRAVTARPPYWHKPAIARSRRRDVLDESARTQVHIQKVRFRQCGQPGMVELHHAPLTGRCRDVSASPGPTVEESR